MTESTQRRLGAGRTAAAVAMAASVGLLPVGCASTVDFGHADPCPYTRMTNSAGDAAALAQGRDCFDATVAEGTPITWDLEVFTVEGDPVFYRVEWDGDQYSVHYDASADTYGGGRRTDSCADLTADPFPACP